MVCFLTKRLIKRKPLLRKYGLRFKMEENGKIYLWKIEKDSCSGMDLQLETIVETIVEERMVLVLVDNVVLELDTVASTVLGRVETTLLNTVGTTKSDSAVETSVRLLLAEVDVAVSSVLGDSGVVAEPSVAGILVGILVS